MTVAQIIAPFTATATFMFTTRNDKFRYDGQLCADIYCTRESYHWDSNPFTALESAGVDYKSMKPLVIVRGAGKKLSERHVFGVDTKLSFARRADEPIFQWLDRVMLLPEVRGVSVVIPADRLTKEQVLHLFNNLGKPKYQAETTAKLVGMFRTPVPDTPAELVARQKFAPPATIAPGAAIDHPNVAPEPETAAPDLTIESIAEPEPESAIGDIPDNPSDGETVEQPAALSAKELKVLYQQELGIKAPNIKVHHLQLLYTALLAEKTGDV
jgi:hypothetical protein